MTLPRPPDFCITVEEAICITLMNTKNDPRMHLVMQMYIREDPGQVFQVDMGELDLNLVNELIRTLTNLRDGAYSRSNYHDHELDSWRTN